MWFLVGLRCDYFLVSKYIFFENNRRFCSHKKIVFINHSGLYSTECRKYSPEFNTDGKSLKIWNVISYMRYKSFNQYFWYVEIDNKMFVNYCTYCDYTGITSISGAMPVGFEFTEIFIFFPFALVIAGWINQRKPISKYININVSVWTMNNRNLLAY